MVSKCIIDLYENFRYLDQKLIQSPHSCSYWFTEEGGCKRGSPGCTSWCNLETDRFNCTMPSFMGASMLNVDMGLYVDFEIEEGEADGGRGHGRPKGCEGLNRPSWISHQRKRRGTVHANGILPEFTEEGYLEYSDIRTARFVIEYFVS